jgi:hypothetical protein
MQNDWPTVTNTLLTGGTVSNLESGRSHKTTILQWTVAQHTLVRAKCMREQANDVTIILAINSLSLGTHSPGSGCCRVLKFSMGF